MSDPASVDVPNPDVRTGPASELILRWRTGYGAPPPRRIRLEIPGWAGQSTPQRDGASAEPWHCQPFVEGATYGLELLYPYRSGCSVRNEGGALHIEGALAAEMQAAGLPHPFGVFAAGHYGMATALDLLPPPGYALRLGPHPRFFTDRTGEVPLALPGHLQRFWPRQFFAVFRAPPPGRSPTCSSSAYGSPTPASGSTTSTSNSCASSNAADAMRCVSACRRLRTGCRHHPRRDEPRVTAFSVMPRSAPLRLLRAS